MKERISGLTKLLILILCFVAFTNTVKIIAEHDPIIWLIPYNLVFIIPALIYGLISRKLSHEIQKKIACYLLLVYGCLHAILGHEGNFSGAMFFVYAIHCDYSRNKTIVKCFLLLSCVMIKTFIVSMIPVQAINLVFMNFVIIACYFILFRTPETKPLEIEDQTAQIIEYRLRGLSYKEISDQVYMAVPAIYKRIDRLAKSLGCKSREELFYKIGQTSNKIDKNGHI